ncbi:MAG: hypothetical protein EP326_13585 [Deltaproteobacteria bacterium]|nr:MAG: hypothetical protein EP326_13585 [Deltaproteobacteria bacterium]
MRQNAILLLTLSALILGAYIFEELGGRKQTAEEEKRTNLFDMKKYGEVKSFKSPEAEIKILAGGASHAVKHNWPVDPVKLQKFFEVLTGIRAKRILSDEEVKNIDRKTMFPTEVAVMTFTFENGEVGFRLGKKLDTDQSFYLEVIQGNKKDIVIAHDTGKVTTIYNQEEAWRDDTKYKRFLTLFYLKDSWFYDLSIFQVEDKIKIQKIVELELDNFRNKKFKLLFHGGATRPAPIADIGVNSQAFDVFMNKLLKIKAEEILFDTKEANLDDLKSTLNMTLEDGQRKALALYGKYQGKEGYFLRYKDNIFKLTKDTSALFFENVQKFWNRKPADKNIILNDSGISSITFPRGKKVDFKLINNKGFQAKTITPGVELDNREMLKLIDFLSKDADYVSEDNGAQEEGISQLILNLDLAGEKISLIRKKTELIVSKAQKKLKYHYKNTYNLPFAFEMHKLLVGHKE